MNAKVMMNNGSKSILVVDDEEGVREVVSEIISNMGHMVYNADSGERALDMLSKLEFDLVISDVKMAGMDGVAFTQRLRDLFPDLSLGLMTAYPSEIIERMLQEKTVDFLLQKPFQVHELEGVVQELV